ncbi:hypothetical protein HX039_18210 [Myroides marinus]|uniref:hypothetical protein n=1 Tax=Myroides marinus TaxID=703342 RepID=UPI0025783FB2|nr:hypothetical protein [Myroides marinus]MDM1406007.1 hypothetical protein [Myroides marinus]
MKIAGWIVIVIAVVFLAMSIGGLNGNLPEEMFVFVALLGIIAGAYLVYRNSNKPRE